MLFDCIHRDRMSSGAECSTCLKLWDNFAAAALKAVIPEWGDPRNAADFAYNYADAMMEVRHKRWQASKAARGAGQAKPEPYGHGRDPRSYEYQPRNSPRKCMCDAAIGRREKCICGVQKP